MRLTEDELERLRRALEPGDGWHDLDVRGRRARSSTCARSSSSRSRAAPRRSASRTPSDAEAADRRGRRGRSRRRCGGARTPRPAPTASASGSRRRTRSSPASACARSSTPSAGERLLEIGPGTGYYTLDMAEWVGADGQGRDLRHPAGDARPHDAPRAERGLANVTPTLGDAQALPYEDDSFDAAILTTVLGEIPDQDAALREIARVLKPGGRLVVGELFGDPHMVTLGALERRAGAAGLGFERVVGPEPARLLRPLRRLTPRPPYFFCVAVAERAPHSLLGLRDSPGVGVDPRPQRRLRLVGLAGREQRRRQLGPALGRLGGERAPRRSRPPRGSASTSAGSCRRRCRGARSPGS